MTLEHFLSISVPLVPSLQSGMFTGTTARLRPKEITPGNAWRRARPRVSAPEMSTIVRAGEDRLDGTCRGTHAWRKWRGAGACQETAGLPVSPSSGPWVASWGGGHTPHSSPPCHTPLILASSESRSKLTFCTLHYAPPRVPRGRAPPLPRADNLIGQLIFARPHPSRPRVFVRPVAGRGRPPGRAVC